MRIGIVGTGHVGLVTGACFAGLGHEVLCVDNDPEIIGGLQRGVVQMHEPGLPELVAKGMRSGKLRFGSSIEELVQNAQIIFLCVGTPSKEDGAADLSYVEAACLEIARHLKEYRIIVEKSTVPARTGDWIARTLRLRARPGAEFDVVSFPEFFREGQCIQDFLHPDRIVLGVESPRAEAAMRELLRPIEAPLVITDIKSAELIKHASNCFLALKISYINTVADICEQVGADVQKVAEGMGYDQRIGLSFLDAGIGYGGSCFPKDVSAFITMAGEMGVDFGILKNARAVNDERKLRFLDKLRNALWVVRGKTIGILGLSFKPNTDDMRSAPSLAIMEMLLQEGCHLRVYDPVAMPNARKLLGERVVYCADPYEAATGADALAFLTEWDQFRSLDLARIKRLMAVPIIVDGRNIWQPSAVRQLGFEYYGTGR